METKYEHGSPMLPGESSAQYMKRTGWMPPHWTSDQCQAFDAKVRGYEQATVLGVDANVRATARRWLRRYGQA